MYDILSLFRVLYPHLSMTPVRQFSRVVIGLLAMTGQVTMRNISRWTSEGGSYRTVQRFFNTVLPWGTVCWVFFSKHLLDRESAYILADLAVDTEEMKINNLIWSCCRDARCG